ncbi:citrate lyase acyl carrier protein [uncultured Clostridium sp.]|uniref:citrate lyase acyl carrier protein n=1 Tax=uncultured Clostridium sp. TaxID=59620 RepID=UPI00262A75D1|nr:citrate lyase acyl carrier protein [uncultured Clostridium sp.]
MKIVKAASAGTVESSDILITVKPNDTGVELELNSTVEKQFGDQIRKVILETLEELSVSNVIIQATDKGALDCVIKARVQAAVVRGTDGEKFNFGGVK